jgi:hypothetical protein
VDHVGCVDPALILPQKGHSLPKVRSFPLETFHVFSPKIPDCLLCFVKQPNEGQQNQSPIEKSKKIRAALGPKEEKPATNDRGCTAGLSNLSVPSPMLVRQHVPDLIY